MQQPPWLDYAWALLGERERSGALDNPAIVALYRDAGAPGIAHDETAWCAAFVGACLARAGLVPTRSLMARSYLAWGTPLDEGRPGAVAVFSRGADPALGHVGFLIGECKGGLVVLGGNQGDAVSVATFPRTRLLGFRWTDAGTFAPAQPASAAPSSPVPVPDASPGPFATALAHVLEMEGGWSDDPHDPGGPTNQGITLREYAAWMGVSPDATSLARLKDELRHVAPETVRAIYLRRYWQPASCDLLVPAVSFMHFDAAVNHGVGGATRMLQEAAGVDADGEFGPVTRRALADADPVQLIGRYADIRRRRYRALPHFWRFGKGWLRRVDHTLARARTLASRSAAALEISTQKGPDTMTNEPIAPATAQQPSTKWWGESVTIWGALVTAVATVLPALGPAVGLDLTPEAVKLAGDQVLALVQAAAGLVGTVMTIYGRSRASAPLERRHISLRL